VKTVYKIRSMTLADYAAVYRLWEQAEGLSLVEDDEREGIKLYLARNRDLCFVAVAEEKIIGTVLCGHDGRRGVLRHLAVQPEFRKRGIGKALVQKCLAALAKEGIRKCNLYVMDYNVAGMRFWKHIGYRLFKYDFRTLQILTST
jgi:ribosomal protein S18 acetylase RimI-like enzyme